MKIRSFLGVMVVSLVFLFSGCGSSSGGISKVDTKDYAIAYSKDHKSLSGYFTVSLDSIIPQSSGYQREIKLTNFKIENSCNIKDNNLPDSLTLSDSGTINQKVNFDITFNGDCYDENLKVTADEVITITNSNQPNPVQQLKKDGWKKTFKIQNPTSKVSQIIATPSSFNITYPGEKRTIYIEALDSQNNLLSKNLKVSSISGSDPSKDYGSLDAYSIITSDNSKAALIYTAPDNIDDINGTSAIFNITDNETGKSAQVTISFAKLQNVKTNLTIKDSSLLYSSDKKNISGYFEIALDKLPSNSQYTRKVELTNFTLDSGSCSKISKTFTPNSLILSDDDYSAKKINVDISLNGPCDESNLTISADKIVTIVYKDKSESSKIYQEWNKTFDIQTNYTNPASTLAEIVVVPSKFEINTPNETKKIYVVALNANKELLEKNLTLSLVYEDNGSASTDYGSLDKYYIATSKSSKATIAYTAPSDISDINGTKAKFNITDNETGKKKTVEIEFNQTIAYIAKDYEIKLEKPDNLTIDNEKPITVRIVNKKDETKLIDNKNVKEVNVSIVTSNMLRIKENNNSSYEYNESNEKTIYIKSFGKSGVAMVKVEAKIFNGAKDVNISDMFPITILSGPVNSISIVYKKTLPYSESEPLFTNIYTIHAVDKYGNPANKGEKIYVGAVSGITKDANGNELYSDKNGTISYNGNDVVFQTDKNLSSIDLTTSSYKNVLVVLANEERFNPDYLGGWDILNTINDTNISLAHEGYEIKFKNENNLTYVIGSEKRVNQCDKSIAVADIDSNDGKYEIGDNGRTDIKLTYDPYLVGKTVYLYANSAPNDTDNDKRKRVGVAISKTLFGTGIDWKPKTVKNDDDTDKNKTVTISVFEKSSNDPVQNTKVHLYVDGDCSINGSDINSTGICSGNVDFNIFVPAKKSCNLSILIVKEH